MQEVVVEQSLMKILSVNELKIMKEQPWWTACNVTPYFVKGVIVGETYIIIVTNLRMTWVRKADRLQIMQEKQTFINTVETNSFAGICELLEMIITRQNDQNSYQFEIDYDQRQLIFNFQCVIKIYPLRWQFLLHEIKEQEHFELLFQDLINPLISTVRLLEQRCNNFREDLYHSEKEQLKRMNEREKLSFRSKAIEGELEWKQCVLDNDYTMANMQFGQQANYFMKQYSFKSIQKNLQFKQQNISLPIIQIGKTELHADKKKTAILEAYQTSLLQLLDQEQNVQEEELPHQIKVPKKSKYKGFF